jgi:hypothetical protein
MTIKIKKPDLGAALVHLTFDVSMTQEFYKKEISSTDFPQHGEVFYFYGQPLYVPKVKIVNTFYSTHITYLRDRNGTKSGSGHKYSKIRVKGTIDVLNKYKKAMAGDLCPTALVCVRDSCADTLTLTSVCICKCDPIDLIIYKTWQANQSFYHENIIVFYLYVYLSRLQSF